MARRDDLTTPTDGWRFYVNVRFGMALNVAEGANTVRAMVHTVVVVLLALVAGCSGFVKVSLLCRTLVNRFDSDL